MIRFENTSKWFMHNKMKNYILKNFSYTFESGIFGVYGPNGSGKSSLMRLIAGTLIPNKGNIYKKGLVVPFLQLGISFNDELSGEENIFVNGCLLDLPWKTLKNITNEIISFAALSDYKEKPLKFYSSGMKARLAYSISKYANGDIYIFDEILAVGDEDFQKKCWEHLHFLREKKNLIFVVSHDHDYLKEYSDKIVLCSHETNPVIENNKYS